MNVLLINGSPRKDGCTNAALSEAAGALNANGIETRIYHIGKGPIQDCTACRGCAGSGRCVFGGDGVNECAELLKAADGLIVGSPVYYGAAAGAVCSFLDRLFFLKSGPYEQKPAAAVVCCRRAGSTAALDRLNKYFMLSSMPVVTSQYWNMVHGNTPDEARRDLEGMQTMRTLGNNMAWLLKCIGAAKGAVPPPEREARVATNFIR
jgi:multimeric flavodoxin WrbA